MLGGEKFKRSGVHVNSKPFDEESKGRMRRGVVFTLFVVASLMLVTPAIAGEFKVDLIAGSRSAHGGTDVGDVTVSDSASVGTDGTVNVNLTIKFSAEDPWLLAETHLAVAESLDDIPQSGGRNPKPGKFEYKWEAETTNDVVSSYEYPAITLEGLEPGATVYIAAHAAVITLGEDADGDGYPDVVENESAWGEGEEGQEFSGRNWAMYFTYTVPEL